MLVNLKEILKIAQEDKTAIGMFNATGFDSLQAVIGAAEELNRPVIIAHAEVHNVYNDISFVGPAMIAAAKNAKVPVCVHLDHGVTTDMIYRALRIGFTSVMIDASALPYKENLKLTKEITEISHAMGVSVEAELGRLVTGESGSTEISNAKPEDFYTDPDEAKAFCKQTGIDALAIAFGTAHGFYKSQPKLDFNVVKSVAEATNLPLVMHGGIFKIIKAQLNKHIFQKLNIQGNEIEIFKNEEESYFDKYLNEVLYLFENVDVDVIVFEDMDRFNAHQIFERLREINKSQFIEQELNSLQENTDKYAGRSNCYWQG